MGFHRYTPEQIAFLSENVEGRARKELVDMFNKHFDLQMSSTQIEACLKRNDLRCGRDTHFKPGHIPHNKGKKGCTTGGVATQFKKGQKPHNYKPVGSERVNSDGYIEIKIDEPNKWKSKHVVLWEAYNGPVPKGHAIIFGDGNRKNLDLGNLILVSRRELGVMNKLGLIYGEAELTKIGKNIANIHIKIRERIKGQKDKGADDGRK